jgi:hypothetical protein
VDLSPFDLDGIDWFSGVLDPRPTDIKPRAITTMAPMATKATNMTRAGIDGFLLDIMIFLPLTLKLNITY